jgi:hypothetical protein
LVECHPMQLMLVDVHLVGGKERLPDDMDLPTHERRAFPRGAGSLRIWMGDAPHLPVWVATQQLWRGLA